MHAMVASGEADALVPERVWQELARGLMEKSPSRMLAVLRECGALARVLPELDDVLAPRCPERLAARLEHAAARGFACRCATRCWCSTCEPETPPASPTRVNAPSDCRDLARLAHPGARDRCEPRLARRRVRRSAARARDALPPAERLERLARESPSASTGRAGARTRDARRPGACACGARAVDAGAIAREHPDDIPGAIRRARLTAIAALQPPPATDKEKSPLRGLLCGTSEVARMPGASVTLLPLALLGLRLGGGRLDGGDVLLDRLLDGVIDLLVDRARLL
jgi:tRNA nucleotidyltransferase (CCA-adding enzyme)